MIDYLYRMIGREWELHELASLSWILPLVVALICRRFRRKDHLRIIAFSAYSLLMEYLSSYSELKFFFAEGTNAPCYHLLIPLLFLLMTQFFADYLDAGKHRWLRWALPLVFTILVVLNAIWGDGFYRFPSLVVALYSLTGIVLAIGYFIYLMNTLTEFYLERQPMFWISSGLLIYYSGNFLLWLGLNYLTYDVALFDSFFQVSHLVTILLNGFFTVALLLQPRSTRDLNKSVKRS